MKRKYEKQDITKQKKKNGTQKQNEDLRKYFQKIKEIVDK